MTNSFKPYPAYKPSGVEWLGEVPEHWDVNRLKFRVSSVVKLSEERGSSEIYIALEHIESWTGRIIHADYDTIFESQVKSFEVTDVLFGKLRPYLAKVAYPRRTGVCVGEFLVLRPHGNSLLPGYLALMLRSKPAIDAISASTFGAKMPRADWRFIGDMRFSFPPFPEQTAIAQFLDQADRRIRRYLRATEKLVALLEEQKQVLIHQVVTGQIDVRTGKPYTAYKFSGIEWLGEVPEHWVLRRLKNICRLEYGNSLAAEARLDGEIPVYGSNGPIGLHSVANVEAPCIVVGRKGSFGKVHYSRFPVFAIDTTYRIDRRGTTMGLRWLFYILGWLRLDGVSKDSAIPGLSREDAYKRLAPVPPIPEQTAIARFLDSATANIDRSIARARRQIDLLREYRTRLIADVVTGKLDVRGLDIDAEAAAWPEVVGGGPAGKPDEGPEPRVANA